MQLITFLHEFIKHPKHTGAVAPSSKILAKKMVNIIDFNRAKCIVELGPGTGVFTKEIMKRKKKETIFLLIEINEVFCKELTRKFKNEQNVIVIHGSAENIKKYMKELNIDYIDYVLSGLPFTSLPEEVSKRILNNVMEAIHENGEFITFQYSLVKKGFIQHFFPEITLEKVWLNFPPAYVFSCKKGLRRAYA
ncbi:SAM-dependent methyltransferase [Bacillus cereus]|uniref:class I SAM-dependent methyltransferase n=1 Tax=Bacillus nitratireducens TaxID=2026193 RepID=UPI0002E7AFD3|nr:rRNA adenine N-6-methyltransferase family protein [Bacillus nitratireducens]PEB78366.1 SAM-dependent methyltransferase [Bacillus cereus]OJD55037.1 SAM-dependent methyltransferase [Bacillus nitratireducens]PEW89337.1 SAM-dependent methyltransferase [Bacillus cereus]PFH74104.1 SAM-dependent methyltransferase [Bacillus cereus]PFN76313.1 SAM-dependent methyltransferase [Bacillus cereus]